MNRITKQLKLYRFVTMAKLLPRFWRKSEQIASANGVATHTVFTDMLKCLVKYGASEENYEQFHFTEVMRNIGMHSLRGDGIWPSCISLIQPKSKNCF